MKIYFAGAIRAGRCDAVIYKTMITWLRSYGEVLTEHVGNTALLPAGYDGPDDRYIHARDMAWLADCDCVIAEVTSPSLGVGYELGRAAALMKPVLCFYRTKAKHPLSAMIAGSTGIQTFSYATMVEAEKIMDEFIRKIVAAISGA